MWRKSPNETTLKIAGRYWKRRYSEPKKLPSKFKSAFKRENLIPNLESTTFRRKHYFNFLEFIFPFFLGLKNFPWIAFIDLENSGKWGQKF